MKSSHDLSPSLWKVWRYYDRTESRIGYKIMLGGTKHFGWYEAGDRTFPLSKALRRMEDKLVSALGVENGSKILDCGCGEGNVARYVSTNLKSHVTGIDILDFNIKSALEKSATSEKYKDTHFQWGDYHNLDFGNETFDAVYTMETFVHSSDTMKVLSEFYRVLKPGGKLVLFEYSRTREGLSDTKATKALEDVCAIAAMPAWLKLFDGVLEDELKQSGFTDIKTIDATKNMMPMLRLFAIVGRFPYWLGRKIGKVEKTVNAMSGVEMYRHQNVWRYKIYSAVKPK